MSSNAERPRMSPEETVALTHSLSQWLQRAGLTNAEAISGIAVDLADLLAAGENVRYRVAQLLELNPSQSGDASAALALAAEIEAYLFGELKDHLLSIESAWPGLLEHLDQLSPLGDGE